MRFGVKRLITLVNLKGLVRTYWTRVHLLNPYCKSMPPALQQLATVRAVVAAVWDRNDALLLFEFYCLGHLLPFIVSDTLDMLALN
jgi:hypothetical protein